MERRLGRGLESLLGGPVSGPQPGGGAEIALDRIVPNPFQPRREFSAAELDELRASIKLHGVLQPINVRRSGDHFELISGERRMRAARLAGKTTIPAVIREQVPDAEMLELALVENIQRTDLNPLEKAAGYRELIQRLGLSQEQVATRVGVQRATVTNHLRLLELPESIQLALRQERISMGHARALLALREARAMERMLDRVVDEGLSVRQVEELARPETDPSNSSNDPDRAPATKRAAWVGECERRLGQALGTKVRLANKSGFRGQIVIEYFSREDLDRLLDQLAPQPRL